MNRHYYGGDTLPRYYHYYPTTANNDNEATAVNAFSNEDMDDDDDGHDFKAALTDSEFLLRAALSYDWDTCTQFCHFLQQLLTKKYGPTTWKKQSQKYRKMVAAKEQLIAQDQWGNTALHAACYNAAPLRVVLALLQAAARASLSTPLCTMLSRDQSTPLLVACATGASVEVIEALLHPPCNSTMTALPQIPTATNVAAATAMVEVADQQGSTPLSELAIHYELRRKSPMHTHTSLPLDQVQYVLPQNNNQEDPLFESFHAKLRLLLQAAWDHTYAATTSTTIDNNNNNNHPNSCHHMISLVHGLAHAAMSCPQVITRLVLRWYPHMTCVMDAEKRLPLHLAIARVHPYVSHNNTSSSSNTHPPNAANLLAARQRHAYGIQQLLLAYPQAARIIDPNSRGRLPLVQAIASGWWWHTTTTTTTCSSSSSSTATTNLMDHTTTNKGPIQWLYQAAPEALSQIDPVTGLYPVLLAAATYTSTAATANATSATTKARSSFPPPSDPNLDKNSECHILELDTLYNLLRLHPQIVEESLSSSRK